jgi:membrane-bound metal-dependent hydrolase YbcI (DUF457 family)
MRTYTHGVIGYLLYAKRSRHEQRLAVIGGILPDVFFALGFVAHSLDNLTHSAIAAELHTLLHHATLHTVTVAMHSFVIVGPCLALSAVLSKPALPFFVGMLAHSLVDFLTHRQWAYNHLFPLPFAPIRSIVSYTDVAFTIVEHALLLLFVGWWVLKRWQRQPSVPLKHHGLS